MTNATISTYELVSNALEKRRESYKDKEWLPIFQGIEKTIKNHLTETPSLTSIMSVLTQEWMETYKKFQDPSVKIELSEETKKTLRADDHMKQSHTPKGYEHYKKDSLLGEICQAIITKAELLVRENKFNLDEYKDAAIVWDKFIKEYHAYKHTK